MKWFYIGAVLISLGLALSPLWLLPKPESDQYANAATTGPASATASSPASHTGPIVRYDSYGDDVKSIDPASAGDTLSAAIQGNFHEGLYTYHYLKRDPLEVIPQLAEGMPQVSADGLTYTIKLKKDVKFFRNPCFGANADGSYKTRTVKADDFVTAYKRIADFHVTTGLAWAFLSERIVGIDEYREKTKKYALSDFSRYDLPVEGLQAVDDLTFQIKLVEPFPQMLYVLAIGVYAPIPREAIDHWLKPAKRTEFREAWEVVGTGPYLLSTFKRKGSIIMQRNPDFRPDFYPTQGAPGDKEAGLLRDAGKRVPFIDVLHYDFVAEDYSTWMRFLTKQTDAAGIPKEVFESVITPGKELDKKWTDKGIVLRKTGVPVVYWLTFNMEDAVVGASPSLRQALCLAFDVENYIKVLFNGRGFRAINCVPEGFVGHKEAGQGPYFRLDMEAARKKLEQAKTELQKAGRLSDGKMPSLKLDVGAEDAATRLMGEFVKYQFSKVGVELKVVFNDWSTLQEKVNNKQCQIYSMGWHADYPDAENFLQLFYSPNIAKQTNNSNYSNKEFDKLHEKARVMPDSPERTKLYVQMINIISADCPVLMLTEPLQFVLSYKWVENVKAHPIGYGFTKFHRIDVDLRRGMGGR